LAATMSWALWNRLMSLLPATTERS